MRLRPDFIAKPFSKRQQAASSLEYAVLIGLIGALGIGAVSLLGKETNTTFENTRAAIDGSSPPGATDPGTPTTPTTPAQTPTTPPPSYSAWQWSESGSSTFAARLGTPQTQAFTLRNKGTEAHQPALSIAGPAPAGFAIASHDCQHLAPGQTCQVQVRYTPPTNPPTGLQTAALRSNDVSTPLYAIASSPGDFVFEVPQDAFYVNGNATSQTIHAALRNTSQQYSAPPALSLGGQDVSSFTLTNNTCHPNTTVQPGDICMFSLQYTATDNHNPAQRAFVIAGSMIKPFYGNSDNFYENWEPYAQDVDMNTTAGQAGPVRSYTLRNQGSLSSPVSLVLAGPSPTEFEIINNTCTGSIAPSASCTFGVRLKANGMPGNHGAEVLLQSALRPHTTGGFGANRF